MRRGHRIGIIEPHSKQAPFLEYDERTRQWRVWASFDDNVDGGTYIVLYSTGQSERVTQRSDGMVENITILTGPVA
jgi:hypothetical protein